MYCIFKNAEYWEGYGKIAQAVEECNMYSKLYPNDSWEIFREIALPHKRFSYIGHSILGHWLPLGEL